MDRRGAVAAALVVTAAAMLGMAALATEGGVWLLARRNAQNAADAAAYGGMQVLAMRPPLRTIVQAEGAATEIAGLNGFTANAGTTVVAQAGMWSGNTFTAGGTTPNAMRVEITQNQTSILGRLISAAVPQVWGGAVASQILTAPVCTLSIPPPGGRTSQVSGTTNITGSTGVNAPNCVIASNGEDRPGRDSLSVGQVQTGTMSAALLYAAGSCDRCDQVSPALVPNGYRDNQPPLLNPYQDLDSRSLNPMTSLVCANPVYRDAAGAIMPRVPRNSGRNSPTDPPTGWTTVEPAGRTALTPSNAIPAICEDISPGGNQSVVFNPDATYYFNGQDLTMSVDTASITGRGVTLVFTGDSANNVGTIKVTGGTVDLVAPSVGTPSIYDGVVIYRDVLATPANSDMIQLTGNAGSTIFGGIYAPTTEVQVQGNTNNNPPPGAGSGGCTAIVAGAITFTGASTININACGVTGTEIARVFSTILVQ
jgi:hypothetical protein